MRHRLGQSGSLGSDSGGVTINRDPRSDNAYLRIPMLAEREHNKPEEREEPKMIDIQQMSDLLHRAVDEKGYDYTYPDSERKRYMVNGESSEEPMCSYYNDADQPSCIVGHVMEYLGLREAFLQEREDLEGTPAAPALFRLGVELDNQAAGLASRVQSLQDRGEPWGGALMEALKE